MEKCKDSVQKLLVKGPRRIALHLNLIHNSSHAYAPRAMKYARYAAHLRDMIISW